MACRSCENKKSRWANVWAFLNKEVQLEQDGDWYKVVSIESVEGPVKRIGLYMGPEENLQWILPSRVRDIRES
jgi:hypothetical protein